VSARVTDDDHDAAVDEMRRLKLALARVLYLGSEYDAGFLTPSPGEITDAALKVNLHVHTIEALLSLASDEGSEAS
jgi:hypothetical protein